MTVAELVEDTGSWASHRETKDEVGSHASPIA
jgi:hypothetical protein